MRTHGDFGELCNEIRHFRGDTEPLDVTIAAGMSNTRHRAVVALQETLIPDQGAPRTEVIYDVETFVTTEEGLMRNFVRRRLWEVRQESGEDGHAKAEFAGVRVSENQEPHSSDRTAVWTGNKPEELGEGAETLCIHLLEVMDMARFLEEQSVTAPE